MTDYKNKFNTKLPGSFESLYFIEKEIKISNCDNEENLYVISYGALNHKGILSPEFGGIALVNKKPNIIVCIKYIPWDKTTREDEAEGLVNLIEDWYDNKEKNKEHVIMTIKREYGYFDPDEIRIKNKEFYEKMREAKKAGKDNEIINFTIDKVNIKKEEKTNKQYVDGEELI